MAETTNVTVRMDKDLKEQAENLFSEMGMNLTTALNVFMRQSVRQGKIPFEISLATPSNSNMQARIEFGKVIREIQEDSVRNGTDSITLDEINAIIAEVRREQ